MVSKKIQKFISASLILGAVTLMPISDNMISTAHADALSDSIKNLADAFKNLKSEKAEKSTGNPTVDNYYKVGYNHFKAGDWANAAEYFTKAIELQPDNFNLYNRRGICYIKLQNYEKSIVDYTIAISLQPDNETLYSNRADAYYKAGEYAKAAEDYTKYLSFSPNVSGYLFKRGRCYYELKNYNEAISDLTKMIQMVENRSEVEDLDAGYAYEFRGKCYEALNQTEKAKADLDKASTLVNNEAIIKADEYDKLAWDCYLREDYKEAVNYYTKVIELMPNHFVAYDWRAWNYYKLKDYQKSTDDYNKIIEINPNIDNWGRIYDNIGYNYDNLKNKKMAKIYHNKAKQFKKNKSK